MTDETSPKHDGKRQPGVATEAFSPEEPTDAKLVSDVKLATDVKLAEDSTGKAPTFRAPAPMPTPPPG
jgi:hypothetical protein